MTHKTSDQTRFHWCKQMPSTLFLCMMPAYCRITSPAEPAATGSQQSQLETWWGHGGRGGASCSSTAENVSPLSWAANHTPACDCIFTAAKVELLCATQWTPCNELQGMQCSPRLQHCPSLHIRINSLSPGQTGAASRRPLRGIHLFWWPCGVTYKKVIQGYFWKSETKNYQKTYLPVGFKKLRNMTCTVQK